MSLVLFHGAKKNVGDYLIKNSALKLMTEVGNIDENDITEMEIVFKELSEGQRKTIKNADAVVMAGGPAYSENFYPNTYPCLDDVLELGVPVIPLGLGWNGRDEESFEFTEESIEMIKRIHNQIDFSGVRDIITQRLLKRHVENVKLVGCPAWYNKLDKIGDSVQYDGTIDSIAITTPASTEFRKQFEYLMKKLSKEFSDAELYCCFHRGIYNDEHSRLKDSLYHRWLKFRAERLGFQTVNMAYRPEKLELYKDIDLHIGYRVHGHISFLGRRKPSYLIHEDGRGQGFSESLDIESDEKGFEINNFKTPIDNILDNLREDGKKDFEEFNDVFKKMDSHFRTMKEHVNQVREYSNS